MEKSEQTKKYVFWSIIAGVIILSYLILNEMLIAIITGAILAYALKPFHDKLSKKIPKRISAFSIISLAIAIIIGFIVAFAGAFINQLSKFLNPVNISAILEGLSKISKIPLINNNLEAIISRIGEYFISLIPQTISYIPSFILHLFIIIFTAYYLLIDWDKIEKAIINILPFKNKVEIVDKIKKRVSNIIMGTCLIALIEIILSAVVFKLLGIDAYLVLAFAIGILAFIPALGPAIIWVPLAIIKIIYGQYFAAAGIIGLGITLSLFIDNLLRARILSKKTGTHPAIMLFGIIGGIKLFGIIGLIIGPLILTILVTIIENMPKAK
ncbi:AI-2E family transporter [Candidatus Pacearchaeota archaeon]|nr:AI-2E family transporter [Candidatus Pacearchaeota archaeon]